MVTMLRLCTVLSLVTIHVLAKDTVETKLDYLRDGARDWLECYVSEEISQCLEERTSRKIHEVSNVFKKDVLQYFMESKRLGKMIKDDSTVYSKEELAEINKLEKENEAISEKIKAKESKPNGIVDEISDLFTYGVAKILGYFAPAKQTEEELAAQIAQASDRSGTGVEARGHKKKYLKKQNKHLKIILLIMLFKNKMKMWAQKIQVLLQFKMFGIAVVNLLINVVRLWLDLKKKKPHKVVYYENAHHQHHYDHEHIHDEGGHYSHPGSHSHYSHHEEDYGGGPWPWSRAYIEKQSEQAFQTINSQSKPTQSPQNMVYLRQRLAT